MPFDSVTSPFTQLRDAAVALGTKGLFLDDMDSKQLPVTFDVFQSLVNGCLHQLLLKTQEDRPTASQIAPSFSFGSLLSCFQGIDDTTKEVLRSRL